MSARRLIEAEITLLPVAEGGRTYPDGMLEGFKYRPGIVLGSPKQREPLRDATGRYTEIQLGVAFRSGPHQVEPGKSFTAVFAVLAWPDPICDGLTPSATFTVREATHIVGFGRVNRAWTEGVT